MRVAPVVCRRPFRDGSRNGLDNKKSSHFFLAPLFWSRHCVYCAAAIHNVAFPFHFGPCRGLFVGELNCHAFQLGLGKSLECFTHQGLIPHAVNFCDHFEILNQLSGESDRNHLKPQRIVNLLRHRLRRLNRKFIIASKQTIVPGLRYTVDFAFRHFITPDYHYRQAAHSHCALAYCLLAFFLIQAYFDFGRFICALDMDISIYKHKGNF